MVPDSNNSTDTDVGSGLKEPTITITIDGKPCKAYDGQMILEVAQANGIAIPTLCHHKGIEPIGACRLCIVETEQRGWTKIVASCSAPVRDGMIVRTATDRVINNRKVVLELLLARAPKSETIQALAKMYGVTGAALRHRPPVDPDDKCIMCGLCVRVCHEVMKVGAIGFAERGWKREIATPFQDVSEVCVACGACEYVCPTGHIKVVKISPTPPIEVPNEFEMGMASRPAVSLPNLQATPKYTYIDNNMCMHLNTGACGVCETVCEAKAINYDDVDRTIDFTVGAVVIATGYEQYDLANTEYNIEHPNVVTGLHIERLLSASGPTEGHIKRPSDGKTPKSITFIQCAGSRDEQHMPYCSKICCMYTTKNAGLIKNEYPDMEINICYIDFRAGGRDYEEYYQRLRNMGVNLIRGRPSEIYAGPEGSLVFDVFDQDTQKLIQVQSDMVVLATALVPSDGTKEMREVCHLVFGPDQFLKPLHVKIGPVDTATQGIYLAGTAMGPKPIQECITDAGAAASRVATFLKSDTAIIDLTTSYIDPEICIKCGKCAEECVYDAIDTTGDVYKVIDVACQSCGKCASICPTNAIDLRMFLDKQIEAHVDGILAEDPDTIIALVCTQCGYNASDIAGTARLKYPERVKIIKLPCTARVSVNAMLYPFLKGAKGVMVVGCYEGTCHYIDGNIGAKERANLAKQALDLMGVGGWRLEFFNMSSAEGPRFAWAANEMDKRIAAAQASGTGG